jgi:hypothetical protein
MTRQQGHGEHTLVLLLAQVRIEFEARVSVRLTGDGDGLALLRDPADNALTWLEPYLVHKACVVACGGAQHEFRARLIVQEDMADVGLGDARGDFGDGLQHALGGKCTACRLADTAQRFDFRLAVSEPMLQDVDSASRLLQFQLALLEREFERVRIIDVQRRAPPPPRAQVSHGFLKYSRCAIRPAEAVSHTLSFAANGRKHTDQIDARSGQRRPPTFLRQETPNSGNSYSTDDEIAVL